MTTVRRRAARALLLDATGCVLLMRAVEPRTGQAFWIPPGGGLDDGESDEEAVVRELAEELGLELDPAAVGSQVWRRRERFAWDGRNYDQDESFHVVRLDRFTPVRCEDNGNAWDHRWWSAAEIAASAENFVPEELAELLHRLQEEEAP